MLSRSLCIENEGGSSWDSGKAKRFINAIRNDEEYRRLIKERDFINASLRVDALKVEFKIDHYFYEAPRFAHGQFLALTRLLKYLLERLYSAWLALHKAIRP